MTQTNTQQYVDEIIKKIDESGLSQMRVKKSEIHGVINSVLLGNVSEITIRKRYERLKLLIQFGQVDKYLVEKFGKCESTSKYLDVKSLCLVILINMIADDLAVQKLPSKKRRIDEITLEQFNAVFKFEDLLLVLNHAYTFDKDIFYGREFPQLMALQGVKCALSSFRNWSLKNPVLPEFSCSTGYSREEFAQWVEFVKCLPGRKNNWKNFRKAVAVECEVC